MSARPDFERLMESFLEEGPRALPVSSYDAVRTAIDQKRQRFVFGPWREEQIMSAARIALGAAAVVLLAVIGTRFLPGVISGPGATASPTPASTPTSSPLALPAGHVDLASGTYLITDTAVAKAPVTFDLPGGWTTESAILFKGAASPRDAPIVFATWVIDNVYGDACQWQGSLTPVTTAAELVDALATQGSRKVVGPTGVTIGGAPATMLEMSVADGLNRATCDAATLRSWPDPGPDESGGWRTNPGEVQTVYVIDTANGPFVVMTTLRQTATADQANELRALVESVQVDLESPQPPATQ